MKKQIKRWVKQRSKEAAKRKQRRLKQERSEALKQRIAPDDYSGLHWLTAGLFVAAGAEAALGERRGDYRPDPIRWAPLVAAPVAGAAQAARAIWPSRTTRMVAQLANGVALGVGAAGLASSVSAAIEDGSYDVDEEPSWLDRVPSLAPLAFGAVGLLGILLDSDETDDDEDEDYDPRPRRLVIRV